MIAGLCRPWTRRAAMRGSRWEYWRVVKFIIPPSLLPASLPAPPEPMSGKRDQPTLVEGSPAADYIVVEECPAPQCVVVEESPAPMSSLKDRPCLVVESSPGPSRGL